MTEGTCSLLGWDPRLDPHPDSVGELNANCHAKIVDPETLEEVKHGERGEIWVQAPKYVSYITPTSTFLLQFKRENKSYPNQFNTDDS